MGRTEGEVLSYPACVLLCSSDNTAELGGRWAIGIYISYGFGVKRIFEMPMVVARIGTGGVQHAVAGSASQARPS